MRDEAAYDAVVAASREAVASGLGPAVHDVMRVLEAWRTTDKAISGRADLMTLPALTDMRAQVGRLMAPGFVGDAGVRRLRDYPRYLGAVTHRRERLDGQVARDRQLMDQLAGLQEAWLHAVAAAARRPAGAAAPARRAVDARGVPRLALRPAARHAGEGQRPAHPQGDGARLLLARPRLGR